MVNKIVFVVLFNLGEANSICSSATVGVIVPLQRKRVTNPHTFTNRESFWYDPPDCPVKHNVALCCGDLYLWGFFIDYSTSNFGRK